jgi:hypothetical protein
MSHQDLSHVCPAAASCSSCFDHCTANRSKLQVLYKHPPGPVWWGAHTLLVQAHTAMGSRLLYKHPPGPGTHSNGLKPTANVCIVQPCRQQCPSSRQPHPKAGCAALPLHFMLCSPAIGHEQPFSCSTTTQSTQCSTQLNAPAYNMTVWGCQHTLTGPKAAARASTQPTLHKEITTTPCDAAAAPYPGPVSLVDRWPSQQASNRLDHSKGQGPTSMLSTPEALRERT